MVAALGLVFGILKLQLIYFYYAAFFFMIGGLQWGLQHPEMFVFYGTDLRQLMVCGGYFWVGYVLAISRLDEKLSATAIVVLLIAWFLLLPVRNWFIGFSYLVLPCLLIFIGQLRSKYFQLINKHDYSYGLYIYAFPLQQLVAFYFPGISFYNYNFFTLLIAVLFAAASWHWVEKPALGLKPVKTSIDLA